MASSEETTTAGSPNYGERGTPVRDMNEALRELHEVQILSIDDGRRYEQVLSVPAGRTVHSIKPLLDEYLEKPERRTGTARAFTLASLIGLVSRFKSAASAVFMNPDHITTDPNRKKPSVVAVFDYHPANTEAGERPTDWLQHRAIYEPQLTDEWKAWMSKNKVFMTMPEFGLFLEERSLDLIAPHLDDPKLKSFAELVQGTFAEPHRLMQLARSFEVNVDVKAKNAIRLASGEINLTWDETHRDGQGEPIKVPNLFVICIPVFYAGVLYRIAAKLRYRVSAGVVTWAYELVQPELAFNSAFDEMGEKIDLATGVPVFVGQPE